MYFLLSILQFIVAIILGFVILFFAVNKMLEISLIASIFGFCTLHMINYTKHYLKLLSLGKSIRNKPSNRKVKEYISYIEGRKSLVGHPNTWGSLRETYRQISEREDIDYDFKLQLFEALNVKGTRGIYASRKSGKAYNQEKEEKIRQAGEEGERQVEHALGWLDRNQFSVFSDIRLPYKSQQFDTIVVGCNGVFNIETKNFIGDLNIDEEGNWYRIEGENKTGTENVNFQVRRHNKVLNNVLEGKLPIVDLIVWTNVESIIEGTEYSSTKIIKVDQLVEFIECYNGGTSISKEEIDFSIESIERNKVKLVSGNIS